MKKLITMIGAAAAALGLYAEAFTFTGSNFEQSGWSAGDSVIGVADDGTVGDSFWVQGDDAESTAKIAAETTGLNGLIGEWAEEASDSKVVDIKTKLDKPVYRNVQTDGTGVAMGECVFFDSLVKFTACDEPIDVTSLAGGSKLAVWIHEDEDKLETNLFVTAGYFTDTENTTVATNYNCGGISSYGIVPGEWCRLTIKTIADITNEDGVPGFAIFVNGDDEKGAATPVACTESKGVAGSAITKLKNVCAARGVKYIFPSIDQASSDKAKVVGVGFAGQGSVDEVTFTASDDSRAFAADPEIQMFTINWADGDITALAINGEPVSISGDSYSYPLIGVTELTVTPTFAEGKKMVYDWDNATDCTATFEKGTITVTGIAADGQPVIEIQTMSTANGATIGDRTYPTLGEAFVYLNNATFAEPVTIQLGADSVLDPSVGFVAIEDGVEQDVTLDLNGKTITGTAVPDEEGFSMPVVGNMAGVKLTIIDSGEGGKIIADDGQSAVIASAGTLAIEDGIFDGAVEIYGDSGADGSLIGGKYLASKNGEAAATFTLADYVGKGQEKTYAATDGEGEDYGYIVVAEKADEPFSGGTGDENDPYIISNATDLVELQTKVAAGDTFEGKFFRQDDEVDLANIAWDGIGKFVSDKDLTQNYTFDGIYDGNGQTVKNVTFAKRDYNGLFGLLAGEAQVKNLTVEVVGFDETDTTTESYGAAAIVGYSYGTDVLVENCTAKGAADNTVLSGTHNIGGIGCRLSGTITLKNCTNELNLATTYSKIGGMCAITSGRELVGNMTFDGCVNKGSITAKGLNGEGKEAGSDGVAGILAYIEKYQTLNIKDCQSLGVLAHAEPTCTSNKAVIASILGKTSTYTNGVYSGNVAKADYLAVGTKAINGFNYATVDGDGVATFIADTPLAADQTYKVMTEGNAPTIALAVGQSITFDQTLATITTSGITAPAGYEIVPTGLEKVITYAPAILNYNITYVYKTNYVEIAAADIAGLKNDNPTSYTVEDVVEISTANITATDFDVANVDNEGWAAGEKTDDVTVTVTLTEKAGPPPIDPDPTKSTEIEAQDKEAAEAKAAMMDVGGMPTVEGLDQTKWNAYFDKIVSAGTDATHWNVTATLKPEIVKAEAETTTVAAKLGDIAAASDDVDVSITGAKPGLWYSLYEGAKLDNTRAEGTRAMADKDGKVTLTATHYDGSGFYQVKVNVADKK